MRSITLKLVLAFLGVSLVSVLLIVLFARYTTAREFRRFTETNDQSTILNTLKDYYDVHGSWEGIDHAELFLSIPNPKTEPRPPTCG